jgi:hypothetical protein
MHARRAVLYTSCFDLANHWGARTVIELLLRGVFGGRACRQVSVHGAFFALSTLVVISSNVSPGCNTNIPFTSTAE